VLPLLFAAIVFAFSLLGSLVFVLCTVLPQTRRFALSAALWCALWGPCSVGLMVLAGLGIVTAAFVGRVGHLQSFHQSKLVEAFGWGYLVVGVIVTFVVATGGAWLHQVLVRRITFVLFRLYATVVCGVMGSVFGLCLGWWFLVKPLTGHVLPFWICVMVILILGFGSAAYNGASGLRGEAPSNFTWITPEEFTGKHLP
jgi:hypothetical protein